MPARKANKIVTAFITFGIGIAVCLPQGRADFGRRKIEARLSGTNEVPANMSAGTGKFEARIEGDRIEFELRYSNVTGTPTMAHIHLGQRGVNGGVFTFLCGGPRPACPAAPAIIQGTIAATDILALPTQNLVAGDIAAAIRAIRHGVTYVNVHTPNSPSGEIRGQVRPDFELGGRGFDD